MRENFPAHRIGTRDAFGIDRYDDALRAVMTARIRNQLRILHRRRIDADFVRARVEQPAHVFDLAHAAADRERNENLCGDRFDDMQDEVAIVAARGDVQKGDLVSALPVVARRNFYRVPGIAQADKIDALDHAAGVDVETGNDALGEHAESGFGIRS